MGKLRRDEQKVAIVVIITILLWFFRRPINTPLFVIPGWSELPFFESPKFITDSVVAMLAALALFIIPKSEERGTGIIEWTDVQKLPLGILFLFGAGFSLAKAFEQSGLSALIASQLDIIGGLHPLLIVLVLCAFMSFFTEITSNTASTMLLLPVLSILVQNNNLNPMQILFPVTLSASFAFMLPVATPPNTIVFGTEKIPIQAMIRYGVWLNLIGVLVVGLMSFWLI